MKFSKRREWFAWLIAAVAIATAGLAFAAAPLEAAPGDYFDDFTGALDAGWTIRDGYADQFPADTANHATIAPTGDHLSLSFPAGAEHNQWWLRQAEVQRPYLGGGTYQIKIDSSLLGDEQVGLSFETSPGTFMQFMLYSTNPGYTLPKQVYAYAERFVNTGGTQFKATVAGASTGLSVPQTGPWYLRVTVDDDANPLSRVWTFEWSLDGVAWTALTNGVLETGGANIGAIQHVGVFAGNQPLGFAGFDAQIDYFSFSAAPIVPAPAVPAGLAVSVVSDTGLAVSWDDVAGESNYQLEVSENGGGFVPVPQSPLPANTTSYAATGLTTGIQYCYQLQATNAAGPSGYTTPLCAAPQAPPPVLDAFPSDGRVELTWAGIATADSYNLYRTASPGGAPSLLGSVTDPSYADTDVINGTTYYYSASVVVAGVEGGLSVPVRAVPRSSPFAGLPSDGLVLGLSARDLAVDLADGDAVPEWRNVTGGPAVDASAPGFAPTFVADGINGEPAVRFDGVDDYLDIEAGFDDFTAGGSIFVVARPAALQSGFKFLSLGNGAGAQNIVLGRAGNTPGLQYFTTATNGAFGFFNTADALTVGETVVMSAVQSGGIVDQSVGATVRANGETVGSGNVFVPPVTTRATNFIGKSYWPEGIFEGDISEVLVYNRELTPTEQAAVETYLLTLSGVGPLPVPSGLAVGVASSTSCRCRGPMWWVSRRMCWRLGPSGGPFAPVAGSPFAADTVSVPVTGLSAGRSIASGCRRRMLVVRRVSRRRCVGRRCRRCRWRSFRLMWCR